MTKQIIDKRAIPSKLLWIDLEMTGLEPEKDVILEVALEVTDFSFDTLTSSAAVIHHEPSALANMNAWARDSHTKSGLLDQVKQSQKSQKEVVNELTQLIRAQFGKEPAILAGNSIHTDRRFIARHWPEIESLLHYRMLDVSSFKIVMQGKYGVVFDKREEHRALGDIHESIAELKYYLARLGDA